MVRNMPITEKFYQKGTAVLGLSLVFVCTGPSWTDSSDTFLSKTVELRGNTHTRNHIARRTLAYTHLSDDKLAALTVYLEARGESFAGKMAVAAVIRNRMKLKYQSDGTVKGTVLRPKQFEPWIKKQPHQVRFDPNESKMRDSMLAWRMVQDGREVVKGAVLFYNPRLVRSPRWARQGHMVASIGGHEFYVPSKRQI